MRWHDFVWDITPYVRAFIIAQTAICLAIFIKFHKIRWTQKTHRRGDRAHAVGSTLMALGVMVAMVLRFHAPINASAPIFAAAQVYYLIGLVQLMRPLPTSEERAVD